MYISKNLLIDNRRKLKSMSKELINKGEIQINIIKQLKEAELKNDNVCIKILMQSIQELAIDILVCLKLKDRRIGEIMDKCLLSSIKMDYATPFWLFDELDNIFDFKVDLAADENNKKCLYWITKENNSLEQKWNYPNWCWLNPPYGRELSKWVKKSYESESKVCMLIPARPDTNYFHMYIKNANYILFIKGRLKFDNCKTPAPFPSMLVFFGEMESGQIKKLKDLNLGLGLKGEFK